jgi:Ca2+-binding EF-hand superfamily protein
MNHKEQIMTSPIQSAYGAGAGSGIAQWRPQFKTSDADKDGQITRDELVASLQDKLSEGSDAGSIADRILSRQDKDGDGRLNQAEFTAGRPRFDRQAGSALLAAQETEQSDPSTDATALITRYDTDQDGNLTADELANSLGGTELGQRIAANIVALFDQDGDGSLTADEVSARLQPQAPKGASDETETAAAERQSGPPPNQPPGPPPGPPPGEHGRGQGRLASTVVNFLLQTDSQAEAA